MTWDQVRAVIVAVLLSSPRGLTNEEAFDLADEIVITARHRSW